AGHGYERALGALDNLQVADHEGVVERDRAEGLQPLVLVMIFHELDADFGDHHSWFSFILWHLKSNSERWFGRTVGPSGRRVPPPPPRGARERSAGLRGDHGTERTASCRCRS